MACISFDAKCTLFYATFIISLSVLGFSFYMMAELPSSVDKSLYSALIAGIVGYWLPNPKIPEADKPILPV